jgi:hypothetical protein
MFLMNYDRVITHKGASLILSEKMMKQAADFQWTLRDSRGYREILAYSHDHKIKYPSPIIRA